MGETFGAHSWATETSAYMAGGSFHESSSAICFHCGVAKPASHVVINVESVCPGSKRLTEGLAIAMMISTKSVFAWKTPFTYPYFTWQKVLGGPVENSFENLLMDCGNYHAVAPLKSGDNFLRLQLESGDRVFIPQRGNPIVYQGKHILVPFHCYDQVPAECPLGKVESVTVAIAGRSSCNGHINGIGVEIPD